MHHPSRKVRFGPFLLDLRSSELHKGATKLKVPDQSIAILKALLEQPGDLITREQLRERLWPVDTFVDFEHGLNTAVRRLRAALGDSADAPRFIETLPRRGYRFIGVVEPASAAQPVVADVPLAPEVLTEAERSGGTRVDSPPALSQPESTLPIVGWRRRRVAAAAAAVLLVCAVVLVAAWRKLPPDPEITELPFTALEGDELAPSFSPDGREVAFTWAKPGGRSDIYIKAIGSETLQPFVITSEHDEVGPVFSPDGRHVAFLRLGPDLSTVIVKPRDGGPERPITRVSNPHVTLIGSPGPYVAWTTDSRALIYSHGKSLHLRRLDDSRPVQLTEPPPTAARGDVDPALSPDGRTLVFVRDGSTGSSDLYRMPLTDRFEPGGPPVLLLANGYWNRSPAWHPNGRHVIFASGHWGRQRLWFLDFQSPPSARPIPGVSVDAHQPAVSPITGEVVYTRWFHRRQIWNVPLTAPGVAAGPLQPLHTSTRADNLPRLARDASHVAFGSNRSGAHEVWVSRVDGSDVRKATSFDGPPAGCPDWSPDGTQLVGDFMVDGQRDVFLSDPYGGNFRRLTEDPADDVCPRWSADGQSVYFASYRDGSNQLWRLDMSSGRVSRVTNDGGYLAEESPDGRTLYFTPHDGRSAPVFGMPAGGGDARIVIDGIFHRGFSVTQDGIYYVPASAPDDVRFLHLATGSHRQVLTLPGAGAGTLAVDPNHRMLVVGLQGPPPGDLMLVRGLRLP